MIEHGRWGELWPDSWHSSRWNSGKQCTNCMATVEPLKRVHKSSIMYLIPRNYYFLTSMNYRVKKYIKFRVFISSWFLWLQIRWTLIITVKMAPRCPPDEGRLEEVSTCALRTCEPLACCSVHGWVLAITCDQASRKWSQVPRTFLYAQFQWTEGNKLRPARLDRDDSWQRRYQPNHGTGQLNTRNIS